MADGGIALDINGSRVGVTIGDVDTHPRHMSWHLYGGEDEPALTRSCGVLYASVSELCKVLRPKILAIEALLTMEGRNPRTALILFQLTGAARAAGHNAGARVIFGHLSTVRKHFCGRGNLNSAEAEAAIAERCRLLGWTPANHDEGDSAALFSWAMATNFPRWSPKSTPLFRERAGAA